MATRKIIDIEQNGEKVWPKGHAKATFMSNGTTVEDAINSIQTGAVGGVVSETDPIFSASPAASITEAKKTEWNNKVDKISGKQLSTEDFTSALKTKLEGLSNYDDTELSNALSTLRGDFDKLVSGDTTTAIKTFNEVIAFLDGIQDSQDLSSIIASIEQQIAGKMDKVTLATVATSGSYNDLSNKPTIPTAVTESTVSEWGFAKSSDLQSKAEDTSVVHKTGNETITGVKTFNGRVNFLGSGDSNAMYLSTNTRLNVDGTTNTVLGFSSGTFLINNAAYNLTLRGKGTRPTYNSTTLALSSDIPAAVTENTVSGWGFTKNTGTYSKPSGGIPKSDLASAVTKDPFVGK